MTGTPDGENRESGAVFVLAAASLVVLLGMAAFAVDIGWLFLSKSRVQRAADAAALAGVTHLPAQTEEAKATAVDVAGINGYDAADPDTTVIPTQIGDKQLRVEISDEVQTFFMRVFGIDSVTIDARAQARYILPIPMGSPEDFFGADPTVAGRDITDDGGPGFWAAIQAPLTRKDHGDPYATQCYDFPGESTNNNLGLQCVTANEEYLGALADGDPDGYWYAVEVPTGSSALTVQVFDGGFLDRNTFEDETGDDHLDLPTATNVYEIQSVGHDATGGTFTLSFGGETTAPIDWDASAARVASAIQALSSVDAIVPLGGTGTTADPWRVRFQDPGPADLPEMTGNGIGLTGGTVGLQISTVADGISMGPNMTFRLYGPDGTPFDHRDNPLLCELTIPSESGLRYQWQDLCSVPSSGGAITPGVYPLRVFTSGRGTASSHYSLRLQGSPPSGESFRLFAIDRMSIFSNIDGGSGAPRDSKFFLAEVDELHRGKNLVIRLFDPGDADPGVANVIKINGPDGSVWTGGCQIAESTERAGPPRFSVVEEISPGRPCQVDATRTGAEHPLGGFNGHWLKVTVGLPNDYGCPEVGGEPFCWWTVTYTYSGGLAHDRTTWEASVEGSLVSLVFAEP